jgi:hypothetical protein
MCVREEKRGETRRRPSQNPSYLPRGATFARSVHDGGHGVDIGSHVYYHPSSYQIALEIPNLDASVTGTTVATFG